MGNQMTVQINEKENYTITLSGNELGLLSNIINKASILGEAVELVVGIKQKIFLSVQKVKEDPKEEAKPV